MKRKHKMQLAKNKKASGFQHSVPRGIVSGSLLSCWPLGTRKAPIGKPTKEEANLADKRDIKMEPSTRNTFGIK